MKSGQILILVLLVVVVALAVGLSVASRNITNLRTSTQTEQSQRAFTAAEGGIEHTLSQLESIKLNPAVADPGGYNFGVDIGEVDADVNVKSDSSFESVLQPGEVGQVNLVESGVPYSGDIAIEWILVNESAEYSTEANDKLASLELTFVCEGGSCLGTSSGGSYSQVRRAYECGATAGQTGFTLATSGGNPYYCSVTINMDGTASLLRIKPFWRQATVRVTGAGGLPVQSYEIESVASSDIGVTRRVKVTRSAIEQLPAAFDYVLFSEEAIIK